MDGSISHRVEDAEMCIIRHRAGRIARRYEAQICPVTHEDFPDTTDTCMYVVNVIVECYGKSENAECYVPAGCGLVSEQCSTVSQTPQNAGILHADAKASRLNKFAYVVF